MSDAWILPALTTPNFGAYNVIFTIDASTDKIAFIFQATESATITDLGFRQDIAAGTSPTFKIGFQGTTGSEPDGTYTGGASEESATFTVSAANDGTWVWVTLDNPKSVTRGETLCYVVEYSSGTINASNNCSFTFIAGNVSDSGFPYSLSSTGSWAVYDDWPNYGMKSSTKSYGSLVSALNNFNFDSADTPDEYGIAFTVPSTVLSTYQVIGVWCNIETNVGATQTIDLSLYNDTTLLQRSNIAARHYPTVSDCDALYFFDEETLTTLSAGTEYIISLRPTVGTEAITLSEYIFSSAADAQQSLVIRWGGSAWAVGAVSRTDNGAWSAKNQAKLHPIVPILVDATAPSADSDSQQNLIVQNIGTY